MPRGTATAIDYLRKKYGITNTPPTVSISAPTNNASLSAPASFAVTVNASDPDGFVTRVSLLANGSTIATATAPPYNFPVSVENGATVTFTAVATDDKDAVSTSSNVTVTVVAAAPPTLNANSHLKLWLRGDQGTTVGPSGGVLAWADQSGNKNDALQSDENLAPTMGTLNGKPSLHFDGVDDYLDVADSDSISITGDIATFVVASFEDFSGFRGVWAKTSGNQPRPTDYYLASGSGVPTFVRGYTTNDTDNVNQGVSASGRVTANTPVMFGVQQAGTAVTHYLNGQPFGTGTITLTPQDMDTPLKIGSRDDFATEMKGQIAEILIYDAALSSNDLANVRQYLGTKYNIAVIQSRNAGPAVQITGPAAGTNIVAPGPITVTATASDSDGSVVGIDFYANGLAIGSDTTAPYTASFSASFSGPVAISAVATDNLGNKTTATVTINVTGGQTAPIPTAGLALWLRPDHGITTNESGAVTLWQDSSGNKNDAAQTDPAKAPALIPAGLNGLPVLNFDGVDDYLEVPSSPSIAITGDISSFFVVNFDDYNTYQEVWGKTAGNLPAANDYYLVQNSGIPSIYHGNGTGSGIAQVVGQDPIPTGTFVTAGFSLAGTVATHYLNGTNNGSGTLAAAGVDSGDPLRIGTRGDLFTKLKGNFAELLIYGRALNDSERALVEAYFQQKYFQAAGNAPSLSVALAANKTLVLAWPSSADGFTLEATTALGMGAAWSAVTEPVIPVNGQNTVTETASGSARFFRLKK